MAGFDPIAAGFIPAGAAPGNTAPATGGTEPPPVAAANPPGFDQLVQDQVKQHGAMSARAQTYANDMFPLFKAQQELAIAPTGKGSEAGYNVGALLSTIAPESLHRAASYISNLGGIFGGGIMNPEQTRAYAEANKYLTMAQLGVQGAGRSDAGLSTAGAASPSVHIPNDAAKAVIQGMIGLRRMEQDQTLQWQQSGLPIQALNGFMTQLQTKSNPLVYIWDQIKPDQQDKILNKMSAAQQADFVQQVTAAKKRGIYNTFGMGQ